ncbi:hypothetical protein LCER1_G000099 [Lachnellula cervina]|uniref:Cyclin-dependent kinase n=1 Tax=Lachnellula cervina TaxID=1316786 RepID=A0A7D8Z1M2_9HELO|nr:hypothetical protein LCER1_G000099 [Lachnellula cervina]
MSSSFQKELRPDAVANKVLLRAEVNEIGRKLKTRLALAQYKASRGWEDLPLDTIEPKVEQELRLRRPTSSGDILSDSSSSTASEFRYYSNRQLMSSPLKGPAIFSDEVRSRSGSGASSGHRKRRYHNNFDIPSLTSSSHKRFRSSPPPSRPSRSLNAAQPSWKSNRQLTQSSPIKPRKHTHFTTSSGPNVSFYRGSSHMPDDFQSTNFAAASDDDENSLPAHSFSIQSSPPSTPPPARNRGRRNKDRNGKSGEEGADLLLYLATSPSPANPTSRARKQPPSTPPPKSHALPSSMMTTPGGGSGLLSVFGGPNTPSQAFDFSDFVNITPSPAQRAWNKTPRIKTPLTVARRRLTFENSSPDLRESNSSAPKHTGLGMQLGGDLLS